MLVGMYLPRQLVLLCVYVCVSVTLKLAEICRVLSVTVVYLAVSCATALNDVYLVSS